MRNFLVKDKRKKYIKLLEKAKSKFITRFQRLNGSMKRQRVIFKLKKADILLAKPGILSLSLIALLYRILLHSEYVHSMMYIGNNKIIHTTIKDGVTIHKVPRKIYKKNRYTIYRLRNLNSEQRSRIVSESLKYKNLETDVMGLVLNIPKNLFGIKKRLQKIEKNRLWCSKLIYRSYRSVGVNLIAENESHIITSERLSKSTLLDKVK